MSIRLRVILIIVLTNLLIILFSIFSGGMLVSQNIKAAQEMDMQIVADIADLYISNEIELLHLKANAVVSSLVTAEASDWAEILADMCNEYPDFIGAAVFDAAPGRETQRIIAAGEKPAPADAMETTHIREALEGKKKLGTTYFYNPKTYTDPGDSAINPDAGPGDVVFYAAVPFPASQDRLLAVTVSGMFFHEKLRSFQIWDTGHVFMIDSETTLVSNPRSHWVYQRNNIHHFALVDSGFAALAETAALMARGDEGIGYYTVYNIPRVCAYKQVSGSQDGWSLGTVAPLPESPFRNINRGLTASGVIGLVLGLLAAVIGSIFIKKPFEKVKALQEESELNSKYKSQFLANMSHEMRTPLTSVIGLTELTLRTVRLDDETHGNLVKVYRAGETLLGLINDILDISKIEANKFVLNPGEYDLPSILNDTITQSLLYLGEKPVEFILDISEDLPRRLYGDELRVKQIFNNLLSNAFKFTKEGTVTLNVLCEKEGDTIWMTARVTDTGIGIKSHDFEKLFTLYASMDDENKAHDSTRRIEGTGLGLSICKRIAEMMDGSITVQSEYGKGSVFTVKLRQKHIDDSVIGADVVESLKKFHYSIDKFRNADKSRINLSYARVLVVDDNAANLDVAKGLMSLYGLRVDCVTGGMQAIEAICDEKIKYNAVFMDHMMPEMDGIETTKRIREWEREQGSGVRDQEAVRNVSERSELPQSPFPIPYSPIPIIALTANAVIGNEEMFLSKGFNAFLAKPIDLTRLDAVLRQWVRDKEAEKALPDPLIQIGGTTKNDMQIIKDDIPGLDVKKGIAHFIKEDIYAGVLRSYAKNTRPLLDIIKEVNPGNLEKYAVIVHGIRGSSRGIYAEAVGDEAEALEKAAKAGNYEYIKANHSKFLGIINQLINDIEDALGKGEKKPVKDKPDKTLLENFLSACTGYNIDEMDAVMAEIEKWEYTSDEGLSEWLKSSLRQGKYKNIKEKLLQLLEENNGQ